MIMQQQHSRSTNRIICGARANCVETEISDKNRSTNANTDTNATNNPRIL